MNRPLPRAEASSITRIRIRPVRIWASMAAISARAPSVTPPGRRNPVKIQIGLQDRAPATFL